MFFPEDVYQEKKCRLLGKKTPMTQGRQDLHSQIHGSTSNLCRLFMVPWPLRQSSIHFSYQIRCK